METVLVRINNNKAYKLLEDLENLQIITVLEKNKQQLPGKLSEKYAGKLPADVGRDLQKQLQESRNEWNDRNI
jgi:hypothetical protein